MATHQEGPAAEIAYFDALMRATRSSVSPVDQLQSAQALHQFLWPNLCERPFRRGHEHNPVFLVKNDHNSFLM
jgi:hypothetical protein